MGPSICKFSREQGRHGPGRVSCRHRQTASPGTGLPQAKWVPSLRRAQSGWACCQQFTQPQLPLTGPRRARYTRLPHTKECGIEPVTVIAPGSWGPEGQEDWSDGDRGGRNRRTGEPGGSLVEGSGNVSEAQRDRRIRGQEERGGHTEAPEDTGERTGELRGIRGPEAAGDTRRARRDQEWIREGQRSGDSEDQEVDQL